MGSDAQVFAGSATYFVIVTFLIALSPLGADCGAQSVNCNFLLSAQNQAGSSQSNTGGDLFFQIASGTMCVGGLALIAALAFFTGGVGAIGYAATGVICAGAGFSIFAPGVIKTAADAVEAVGHFVFVFFQLLTFNLPIPAWLNGLIVIPGAAPLLYVGLKLLRGGG